MKFDAKDQITCERQEPHCFTPPLWFDGCQGFLHPVRSELANSGHLLGSPLFYLIGVKDLQAILSHRS